ncbi:MAG: chromosome segregation protein SMC [Clostridiales bacterium]|nr:chromosome segregation protein SMC [Clostridiales bacterium]
MNFKKIELIGFKSFADKQEIQFDNGVTCIVGPNGCGKSNVSDAVRWVLGEQSAKTLRGSSMQDVIFSGTQNRKSLSYCEVSLTFDNTNRIFKNLEYDEVVFTRKLFRSGESEYYINKKIARLRDIVDLLHECGVSKEGYTVIGQGKVSEILSSKPEDRRSIFEEAVGIAKTKTKRLETSRKLDRTRDNITRIVDITTELERQREPLRKAADKTRAARALTDQLKYHEVNTYLYKYDNAATSKDKINLRISGIEDELKVRNEEYDNTVKAYNQHLKEIDEADENISRLNEELIDKTQAFERQSGEAKVYNERITSMRGEIGRLTKETGEARTRVAELERKIREKGEYTVTCQKEIEKLEEKSISINEELIKVIDKIAEGDRLARSAQQEMLANAETLADIKQNIGSLSTEMSVMNERQKTTHEKMQALSHKMSEQVAENTLKTAELNALDKKINQIKEEIRDKENDIASTSEYISSIDAKINTLNSAIAVLESNKKLYSNLKESYEGYPSSVRRLMTDAKTNPELAKKIKGLVSDIIKTDSKYEIAISTALGVAVQHIATATPEDAQYLIQYLRQTGAGTATFLPVSAMKMRAVGDDTKTALKDRGALGLATELISYDSYFESVISFLLGNTLVVDNLDNAVAIAKKYRFGFKIVTLEGDVLNTSGSMTGGSRKQGTANLLAMDRKVEEIEKELSARKTDKDRLVARKEQLLKQVEEQKADCEQAQTELQQIKVDAATLRERISSLEISIEDIRGEIESHKDDISLINLRLSDLNKQYTDIEQGNEELSKKKENATFDAEKYQEDYDGYTARRNELTAENLKVQERTVFLKGEIKASNEEIERMKAEKIEKETLLSANAEKVNQLNSSVTKLLDEVAKVSLTDTEKEYLDAIRAKRDKIASRKYELNEEIKQDNLKRDMIQAEITKLGESKFKEETALTRIDTELEYLQTRVWEEYQITYETALPLRDENYDIITSNSEISSLKKKINALGNINYNAIEEFEELDGRYQDMMTQKDDLLKAEEDLKSVIKQLTDEMSATFAEGFAKIRANFTRIFKELFGGGTADLVLETGETDDPLEQGIEIVAEPPGKKLQKISLLSGGEMSLTAIAILFAILRLRPMPFVVLDEIEAALDDANVERFAKYLKNFSQETQFIVITHKKVTMELGDALYGVTMQEKGVSKIVSVKLADVVDTLGA